MKKSLISLLLFGSCALLAACGAQQRVASQCPNIGVNINAPDFSQKQKPAAIHAFYKCAYDAVGPDDLQKALRAEGYVTASQKKIQYQWNLWKQVFSKAKTPEAAQESWMIWDGINQARRAAENATDAADAVSTANTNSFSPGMTCMANGPFLNCH